jgi:endonuclease/exonuclease/phosphatase family metal-dependent hydrolase
MSVPQHHGVSTPKQKQATLNTFFKKTNTIPIISINQENTPTTVTHTIASTNKDPSSTIQTSLKGNVTDKSNVNPWGDKLSKKTGNILRIGCRNIHHLPQFSNHSKNQEIISDIKDAELDILGLSETNLDWRLLPTQDQPSNRWKGSFRQQRISVAQNTKDSPFEKTQYGGNAMISQGELSQRLTAQGKDPKGLGRWVSQSFQGKSNKSLTVFSVYRPVKAMGVATTYQQQCRSLLSENNATCPRDMFFTDLKTSVQEHQEKGDTIVVMGDFNEYVGSKVISSFFEDLSMKEAILHRHGKKAPNTFKSGTQAIDGIFVSNHAQVLQSGYTSIDWGAPTDHRMLWMDINLEDCLGRKLPKFWVPSARKLQLEDPKVVNKFIQLRQIFTKKVKLKERLIQLNDTVQASGFNTELLQELNDLDKLRVSIILLSEHRCRRLKVGNVEWSPPLQQSINRIRYYRKSKMKFQGRKVNSRTLRKLYKKCVNVTRVYNFSQSVCQLKEEFNTYNDLKKQAKNLRLTHLQELGQAQAEYNNDRTMVIFNSAKGNLSTCHPNVVESCPSIYYEVCHA